jgi:hypothetical protein
MKILEKSQLNKVSKKYKSWVEESWNEGGEVPFGIMFLSDEDLTFKEIECIKRRFGSKKF